MKVCIQCNLELGLEEFYWKRRHLGQREARCRGCKNKNSNRIDLVLVRRVRQKRHRDANPEQSRIRRRRWILKHGRPLREKMNEYQNRRFRENPAYRARKNLSCRLAHIVAKRGSFKHEAVSKLLGCPRVWLEVHLESLFVSGMTWDNYGSVWHVDHIKPCSLFDLSKREQQLACFHWTNLQPLFAADNRRKSNKYGTNTH